MPRKPKSRARGKRVAARPRATRKVSPEPQPQPRIIQIELKTPLRRLEARAESQSLFRFAAKTGKKLSRLHGILNRHGVGKAHASFRMRHPGQRRRRSQSEKDHLSRFVDLHFPADADIAEILRKLRALPDVEEAVEVRPIVPPIPADPLIGTSDQAAIDPVTGLQFQWYIYRCGVNRAWARVSGHGVVIADIDAGFLVTHPDLAPNIEVAHMHNAVDGSNDVTAGDRNHGTGVAGIAAAASNNLGIAGIAYSAKLWPVEVDAGKGAPLLGDHLANAIDWVRGEDSGGRRVVINIEAQTDRGGNCEQNPAVRAAIQLAIRDGFVVCVAAGNGGRDAGVADDGTAIPATGSILVGATAYADSANPRCAFGNQASNWGSRVVVSAPGDPTNDVTCNCSALRYASNFGGTSGAAAKVAGAIALMLEANPSLTHDKVLAILVQTGSALNTDEPIGVFLNADAAVSAAFLSSKT